VIYPKKKMVKLMTHLCMTWESLQKHIRCLVKMLYMCAYLQWSFWRNNFTVTVDAVIWHAVVDFL